jgi:hypothetical protein
MDKGKRHLPKKALNADDGINIQMISYRNKKIK